MKNKIILAVFMFTSFTQIAAKDPSLLNVDATNDKNALALKIDCEKSIKESKRAQKSISDFQKQLDDFKSLVKEGGNQNYNRANAWVKSVLFDISYGLKEVGDLYEHCMCLSSDLSNVRGISGVVQEMQSEYDNFATQKNNFIKQVELLKSQVSKHLN